MDSNTIISVQQLYKQRDGIPAINGIDFTIREGARVAIMGETGSGKSTLLKLIAGLEQPDKGQIFFKGQRVIGPDEQLIPGHSKIACMGQQSTLRNNYRVSEFLDFTNALEPDQSNHIYTICSIDHLLNRWTDELSGGEKQRIYLASLLTHQPSVLLLDEPFSSLDFDHKRTLKKVINEVVAELKVTIVWVSHDYYDILPWADDLLIMQSGCIKQQSRPADLFYTPHDVYCAATLGNYNLIKNQDSIQKLTNNFNPPKNKSLFFRPNQMKMLSAGNGGLQARIQSVHFLGTYFLYELLIGTEIILIQESESHYSVGDLVDLVLMETTYHFL